MRVVSAREEFSRVLDDHRATGALVGVVPTMGALHDGHRSLVERARGECGSVAVTIFVNPLQFGDRADLERYPRSPEADLDVCRELGVDVVFAPSIAEMYPGWPRRPATVVSVGGVTEEWEGAARPGHFDGVATVVAMLFALAGRCRAYFGEKDFQQLAMVRRLAADLGFPVEVVGCPTVRDADGLALSSRNRLLDQDERSAATVLWRALAAARDAIGAGERDPAAVSAVMASVVEAEQRLSLDYAAVVGADDLRVPASLDGTAPLRLLIAGRLGPVRLIDNLAVEVPVPGRRPALLGAGSV